jgi:zinc finger HIT domain-containing protein 1
MTEANNKRRSGRVQRQQSAAATSHKWDNDSMREAKKQKYLTDLEKDNFVEPENTESSSSEEDLLKKKSRRGEKVEKKRNRAMFARSGTKTRKNCTSFDQVLEIDGVAGYESHIPSYLTQAAAPSKFPPRKFSPESGYVAHYVDPQSGTRFENPHEQQVLKARKSGLQ